jgi:hypothetical protein
MSDTTKSPACFEVSSTSGELELQFKTGDSCTLYYPYLLRSRLDVTGSIELQFSTDKVIIEGQRLKGLYNSLKKKHVTWIREAGLNSDSIISDEPFVRSITVTPVGSAD